MGVNKVILVGFLGADPETRYMPSGKGVTNARLATSEKWKDDKGERQERTEWHSLVFFEPLSKIVQDYLEKGSQVYVEGKLQTRKWQDKEGKDRYTTEIIVNQLQMLDRLEPEEKASRQPARRQEPKRQPPAQQPQQDNNEDWDDDIPF